MSEPLRTHTERTRDQRRIETLEAELAIAEKQREVLVAAYTDALEAVARAYEWRAATMLMALLGGFIAILALRAFGP